MLEALENTVADEQTIYKFRFNTSDKLIQLTQSQLDRIPYLTTLVIHKDDFLSIQNDQDEYVLHSPIHYNWFMAIFHSITTEQPYALFTELPEDDNILDTLQLFDYLGVNSLPTPLLKEPSIILLNPTNNENEKKRIVYRRVNNLSEARNTAAEFVIALTKNVYNLYDSKTIECIFSLISVIFSNRDVFSSRFRHHTFTIVEEYVFPLFFKKQPTQLLTTIEQSKIIDSEIYLHDDTQPLPTNFNNAFAWKGNYDTSRRFPVLFVGNTGCGKSTIISALLGCGENQLSVASDFSPVDTFNSNRQFIILDTPGFCENTAHARAPLSMKDFMSKELCIKKARPVYFNTMPNRPKVDKFKHRCGPKAQKYR